MGNDSENMSKYAKLREGATRAERKEAAIEDMREAANEIREAVCELRAIASEAREGQATIAKDAADLAECARVIVGEGEDPAEHYRDQMRAGARLAASDVGFREVLDAAAEDLLNASKETAKTTRDACGAIRIAWDDGVINKRLALMSRVFTVGCIVLMLCCVALTATCFVKLEPVFTGKAVVSYEPAYESELDKTKLELEFARNEIDAYRRQFPAGIGPTAQADLDAANQAAQEAYDEAHAG